MTSKIRILIADDHEVVRRGLALVLGQEDDFEIIGEARDGEETVRKALAMLPNILLLDRKMPRLGGLSAAKEIRHQCNKIRILMLSGAPVELAVLDALDRDIDGFVHKDISPYDLAHAIRVVNSGKPYLGPLVTRALIEQRKGRPSVSSLTDKPALSQRELQILKLMATPSTYRQIGEQLHVSEETVRTHVKRILHKLEQPNRTQAVLAGLRAQLITLD
ncbi:MAG: response regulator transcription factor [Candidatus Promineifilaceae bacterium]|nr:response regulator transcription factor [Candidatus Promineifilaceae bacterium]